MQEGDYHIFDPLPGRRKGATENTRSCAGVERSHRPECGLPLFLCAPIGRSEALREDLCKKKPEVGLLARLHIHTPFVLSLKRSDIEERDCIREITHVSGVMCVSEKPRNEDEGVRFFVNGESIV